MRSPICVIIAASIAGVVCGSPLPAQQATARVVARQASGDWPSYGRDPGGERYSPLRQITPANVSHLTVAWRFHTGEAGPAFTTGHPTSLEVTPLVIGGVMYVSTPLGRVFALDAATGHERWRFNPGVPLSATFGDFANRGVAYWVDGGAPPGARCRARIVLATIDDRLIELDAHDGATCPGFGDGGMVNLRQGLRNAPHYFEEYEETSPPAIVRGVIVVGSGIADNGWTDAVSGEVRGYDARTGALRWTFDPVPQNPRDPNYATWRGPQAHRTGAANTWSVIAADTARDMVFLPTTSPSPDYYGGERLGDDRYASSVVALRASTGQILWSFQTVHHDLWDYDNASPPALVTIRRDGRKVPAVLQATKTGMLFVLDRLTGKPLIPVTEERVPASDVPGEEASPTQPFSAIILSPHHITPNDAFGVDSADRAACRTMMAGLRYDGSFTPPSLQGTLVLPSNIGGAHWGGLAYDPERQLAIVPVNNIAMEVQLIPRAQYDTRRHESQGDAHAQLGWEYAPMHGTPYGMRRRFLFSPKGVPCTPPPSGSLVAVNVASGQGAWRAPLPSPQLGGPIATAGGLVFLGATLDHRIRAFDVATGRELWHGDLPVGGKATPMTYAVDGRQFVAIAAGGDGGLFGKSDEIVVFALPHVQAAPATGRRSDTTTEAPSRTKITPSERTVGISYHAATSILIPTNASTSASPKRR